MRLNNKNFLSKIILYEKRIIVRAAACLNPLKSKIRNVVPI
jgi:hypothetical protein